MEVVADLAFEQAVFGTQIPVTLRLPQRCDDCGGTGAGEGTKPVTCADCNGSGQVRRVRQSVLGQMVTSSPCQRCGGLGEVIATPCVTCRGEGRITADKTYQVDVPAGVDTGSTLRLTGRGASGPRGGRSGDLYVHLRVAPHERYERDGDDLVTEVPISIAQAALGTKLDAAPPSTATRTWSCRPARSPVASSCCAAGESPGSQGRGRGDLRAIVRVDVPTKLTPDEATLLRTFAEGRGEEVGEGGQGLFSRIKSAFSVNDELRRCAPALTSSSTTSNAPAIPTTARASPARVLRVA